MKCFNDKIQKGIGSLVQIPYTIVVFYTDVRNPNFSFRWMIN
ncbi:hypothetical protein IFVP182_C290302 [Vibrio parahaemolyticus]